MINNINSILAIGKNILVIIRNRKKLALIRQIKLLMFYLQIVWLRVFDFETDTLKFDGLKFKFANLLSFHNIFADLFVNHEYSLETQNPKPVIIDGGANIGGAVLYFKYFYPHAKIYAFEPDEETFKILNVNVGYLKDVSIYNRALSDKEMVADFYSEGTCSGNNSLLSNRAEGKLQKVKCVKLSKYIKSEIDLLKLDIEGSETSVISELDKTKKLRLVKELYVEYHHHIPNTKDGLSKILAMLENNGFKYQLATGLKCPLTKDIFQDILIYAYVNR